MDQMEQAEQIAEEEPLEEDSNPATRMAETQTELYMGDVVSSSMRLSAWSSTLRRRRFPGTSTTLCGKPNSESWTTTTRPCMRTPEGWNFKSVNIERTSTT